MTIALNTPLKSATREASMREMPSGKIIIATQFDELLTCYYFATRDEANAWADCNGRAALQEIELGRGA